MAPDTLLLQTWIPMLGALSAWLDKAGEEKAGEADALLVARLAPDMYPLGTQIRFACVQVQESICRLKGEDFPPAIGILTQEGRDAAERPGTIAEAQARIAETLALVEAAAAHPLGGDPHRPVAHALPNGMILDLTMEQYARDWALPQFYFHLMTAYAILRGAGVALGKVDYVAHMLAFVRPGTMPG